MSCCQLRQAPMGGAAKCLSAKCAIDHILQPCLQSIPTSGPARCAVGGGGVKGAATAGSTAAAGLVARAQRVAGAAGAAPGAPGRAQPCIRLGQPALPASPLCQPHRPMPTGLSLVIRPAPLRPPAVSRRSTAAGPRRRAAAAAGRRTWAASLTMPTRSCTASAGASTCARSAAARWGVSGRARAGRAHEVGCACSGGRYACSHALLRCVRRSGSTSWVGAVGTCWAVLFLLP